MGIRKTGYKVGIQLPSPFSLIATVKSHGWYELPPFHWDESEGKLVRLDRLPGGRLFKVVIRKNCQGDKLCLKIEPFPAQDEVRIIIARIRRMLQLDADLSEFYSICRKHPYLSAVPEMGAGRILRSPDLYEDAVKAICGTNILWRQAVAFINRLCEIGESLHGNGVMRAFPTAAQIYDAGLPFLRERVRLGYRAESVLELSRRAAIGELDLAAVDEGSLSQESIWKILLSIRGIGKSTASYLMNMLGYSDYLGIDSVTYRFVGERYLKGLRPKNSEIYSIYRPFGRWKGLVYWFEMMLSREVSSAASRKNAIKSSR